MRQSETTERLTHYAFANTDPSSNDGILESNMKIHGHSAWFQKQTYPF